MSYQNLMTNRDKDVFIPLVPSVLGAMLMSKVSRQKDSFRDDLVKMVEADMLNLPEQNYYDLFRNSVVVANGFMEKWGVNYGHSSIKELDTLQMCIENKSRWFTEIIETVQANKYMSYIEYSLRYNPPAAYYTPPEFDDYPTLKKQYTDFCDAAFSAYRTISEQFELLFKQRYPELKPNDIKIKAFENARNVLPLSTLANMGMQSNLRAFCSALSELFAHEGLNAEIVNTAEQMKSEAETVSIGMVKHVEASAYQKSFVDAFFQRETVAQPYKIYDAPVVNVASEIIGDLSLLERYGDLSLMNRFDELPNAFRAIGKRVELLMSEACHHQALRHRAFDLHCKMPDVRYGMLMPPELRQADEAGLVAAIREQIEVVYRMSIDVYEAIYQQGFKGLAPYAVINCNIRRVDFFANAFAMAHFVTLRKEPHAQDEIREIAFALHESFRDIEAKFNGLKFDKVE
ncbi:MAG: hypothetical protein CR995_00570 [Clostridiales bacterium]|nr:MAG: hypothetical protein CR995_00570 [Clostridiales bacterium]